LWLEGTSFPFPIDAGRAVPQDALRAKGFDPLAKIPQAAQPIITLAFELDRERQQRILNVVRQLFGEALVDKTEWDRSADSRLAAPLITFGDMPEK
jgi:hypothetical protein